jgi:hypothetical protein
MIRSTRTNQEIMSIIKLVHNHLLINDDILPYAVWMFTEFIRTGKCTASQFQGITIRYLATPIVRIIQLLFMQYQYPQNYEYYLVIFRPKISNQNSTIIILTRNRQWNLLTIQSSLSLITFTINTPTHILKPDTLTSSYSNPLQISLNALGFTLPVSRSMIDIATIYNRPEDHSEFKKRYS